MSAHGYERRYRREAPYPASLGLYYHDKRGLHAYDNPAAYSDDYSDDRSSSGKDTKKRNNAKRNCICVLLMLLMLAIGAAIGAAVFFAVTSEEDSPATTTTARPIPRVHDQQMAEDPDFEGQFTVTTATWDPAMGDVNSDVFMTTAAKLEQTMDEIFQASTASDVVDYSVVTALKHGSVVAEFIVKFKPESSMKDEARAKLDDIRSDPQQLMNDFVNGRDALLTSDSGSGSASDAMAISVLSFVLQPASTTTSPTTTTSTATTTTSPTTTTSTTTTTTTPTTTTSTTTTSTTTTPTTTTPTTTTTTEATTAEETTTEASAADFRCGEVRVQPDFRIVGGEATGRGVYPWMVQVYIDGRFRCGGSIIDTLHILTAAHCFSRLWDDGRVFSTAVVAGLHERRTYDVPEHAQRVAVERVYRHKDYNPTTHLGVYSSLNDIAVLRLVRPLAFNSRVASVCLPEEDDPLPPRCIVSGWGYTSPGWGYSSTALMATELMSVTLRTYNHEECALVFGETFTFTMIGDDIRNYLSEGVMCAANNTHGGQDACQGDSGGPLFCLQEGPQGAGRRYTQFGVVSWGMGCAQPGKPGFYSYVPYFRRWLHHSALPKLEFLSNVDGMLCFSRYRCGHLLQNTTDITTSQLCSVVSATLACMLTAPQTDRCSRQVALTELRQYLTYLDILDMDDSHNITHCLESLESEGNEVDVCDDTNLQVYLATAYCQAADTSLPIDHLCLRTLPSAPRCVSQLLSENLQKNCSAENIETLLYSSQFYQSNYGRWCSGVCEGFFPDQCLYFVDNVLNSSTPVMFEQEMLCRLLYQSSYCVHMKHHFRRKVCEGEKLRQSIAKYINPSLIERLFTQCDAAYSSLENEAPVCENPELLTQLIQGFCIGYYSSNRNITCSAVSSLSLCAVYTLDSASVYCPLQQVQRLLTNYNGCPAPDEDEPATQVANKSCSGQSAMTAIQELALRHCDVVVTALYTFKDNPTWACREMKMLAHCVSKVANYHGYSCSEANIATLAANMPTIVHPTVLSLLPQCQVALNSSVTGVSRGGVCEDRDLISLYTLYTCHGTLAAVRAGHAVQFCHAFDAAVRCVNTTLKGYGHQCSHLTGTVYGIFTPSAYYLKSYDRCRAVNSTQTAARDDQCVFFSVWSSQLKGCHSAIRRLISDGQCRGLEESLTCLQTALVQHGYYCHRQDVYNNVVNTLAAALGHGQRIYCSDLGLSMPATRCQDTTLLSLAVNQCSNEKTCVSWLELSLCVQRLLDPLWLECSRADTDALISNLNTTGINMCEDYSARLVDNGRGFMYMRREWLVLCGDHWGDAEANVTCSQLGYSAGKSSYLPWAQEGLYLTPDVHATGWMHATCSGSENSLADCQLDRQTPCSKTFIASAICYNTDHSYQLQPTNPSDDYGYVQLTRDEGQGLVCVKNLTDRSAHLLCREAGYVAGMTFSRPLTPASRGPVWAAELNCSREAVDINGCMGGEWTLLQQASDWCQPARVFCFPSEVRFHNGLFNISGLVQMYRPANRGRDVILRSVCRDGFTDTVANITCRQLGFPLGGQAVVFNPFYEPGLGCVRVTCSGDEEHLEDCEVDDVPDTMCSGHAVARCTPQTAHTEPDLSVKLDPVDNGQVLVYTDGQWGTVCADHWTSAEATAVCRQLGHLYGYSVTATPMTRSYPHVLHEVDCQDNATSLADCSFQPVQSDICRDVHPASVICTNVSVPQFTLQGETRPNAGPIYVQHNGTTAPVRARLPQSVAHVFCQSLGYLTGDVDAHGEMVSDVTRHVTSFWWGVFTNCTARAMGLEECLMSGLELLSCSQGDSNSDPRCSEPLASVFCYETGARLHAGFTSKAGIVQLYRNGSWWEICEDDITRSSSVNQTADVICRDVMGSPSAAAATVLRDSRRYFYNYRVSPARATTRCNSMSGVTSSSCIDVRTTQSCYYGSDALALVCYDGTRPNGTFGEFRLDENGLVLVQRYGVWGTVCYSYNYYRMYRLCTHLGYDTGNAFRTNSTDRPVWIKSVNCYYSSWERCYFSGTETSSYSCYGSVVGLRCYNYNYTSTTPATYTATTRYPHQTTTTYVDVAPGPGGDTCGEVRYRPPVTRIIGGEAAEPGQFPWMIMLLTSRRFACGGTIIDNWHVLTAAHCVDHLSWSRTTGRMYSVARLEVIAGKHRFSTYTTYLSEQRLRVIAGVIHPRYDLDYGFNSHDIAVLRLERPLVFNARVSALCMPDTVTQPPSHCVLSGWGDYNSWGDNPAELFRVVLPVLNRQQCVSRYGYTSSVPYNAICTVNVTYGGVGACYGDSGSPLACLQEGGQAYQLVGIASYVFRSGCSTRYPTAFTFVPAYRAWIMQTVLVLSGEELQNNTCFSPNIGNFSAALQCLSTATMVSGLNTTQTCRLYKSALNCVRANSNTSCSYEAALDDIENFVEVLLNGSSTPWYYEEIARINLTLSLCADDVLLPGLEAYTDICQKEDLVLALVDSDMCSRNGTFNQTDSVANMCLDILPRLINCVQDVVKNRLQAECSVAPVESILKRRLEDLPDLLDMPSLNFTQCEDQCLGFVHAVKSSNTCLPLLTSAASSEYSMETRCEIYEETVRCARANIKREGYDCEGQVVNTLRAYVNSANLNGLLPYSTCLALFPNLTTGAPACENPTLLDSLLRTCDAARRGYPSPVDYPCSYVSSMVSCVDRMLEEGDVYCRYRNIQMELREHNSTFRRIEQECGLYTSVEEPVLERPEGNCTGAELQSTLSQLAEDHCSFLDNQLMYSTEETQTCHLLEDLIRCVTLASNHAGLACSAADVMSLVNWTAQYPNVSCQNNLTMATSVQPVADSVCSDLTTLYFYTGQQCSPVLDEALRDKEQFCAAFYSAVKCVRTSIDWHYGHTCPHLEPVVYDQLTPSVYYVGDLNCYINPTNYTSKCRYFPPWDRAMNACHAIFQRLETSPSCSDFTQAVECAQTAFLSSSSYCGKKEIAKRLRETIAPHLYLPSCFDDWPHFPDVCTDERIIRTLVDTCSIKDCRLCCRPVSEVEFCIRESLGDEALTSSCDYSRLRTFVSSLYFRPGVICQDNEPTLDESGRVYVYTRRSYYYYSYSLRPVCGDLWTDQEATAVCRQGGYLKGAASHRPINTTLLHSNSGYSSNWIPYYVCVGGEETLAQCWTGSSRSCSRFHAAVHCYDQVYDYKLNPEQSDNTTVGRIQLSGDDGTADICVTSPITHADARVLCVEADRVWGTVASHENVTTSGPVWRLTMACRPTAPDVGACLQEASMQYVSDAADSCQIPNVRCHSTKGHLSRPGENLGIASLYDYVPLAFDYNSFPICRDGFTDTEASVLCREVGYDRGGVSLPFNPFYPVMGRYFGVNCTGTEASLEDCDVMPNVTSCSGQAVVQCTQDPAVPDPAVDLKLTSDGRHVLVYRDGQWGTVCADRWTDDEASVVCRQLFNVTGVAWMQNASLTWPHVVRNVTCTGAEEEWSECQADPVKTDDCQYRYAAAVYCFRKEYQYSLAYGNGHSYGFVTIRNVTSGSTDTSEHLLVAYLSSVHYQALCRQMGFLGGQQYLEYLALPSNLSSVSMWRTLYDYGCFGLTPAVLDQCRRADWTKTVCSNDSGLHIANCTAGAARAYCFASPVRFAAGPTSRVGVILFNNNVTWSAMCASDVSNTTAGVICRDLLNSTTASGFTMLYQRYWRSYYYYGSVTRINSTCTSGDTKVSNCIRPSSNTWSCSTPAAMLCYQGQLPSGQITEWKIDEGDKRVYVKRYGEWGTVCNSGWDDTEASLLCQHLGYSGGSGSYRYRDYNVPQWVSSVYCYYRDTLEDCTVRLTGSGYNYCSRDARAVCY